jgi:chromosome partitioning protein
MTKIISIGIQKGGSAKTASTAAIAEALVSMGKHVLVIDFDPQASLTENYGIDASGKSIAEAITDNNIGLQDIAVQIEAGFVLIPSDIALATAEMQIPSMVASEQILKGLLADVSADYILIDCPPSLGQLTLNALTASDYVLIPIKPNASDLRALRLYLQTIEVVRAKTNPQLKIGGIFATMADSRLIHHQQAIEQLRGANLGYLDIEIRNGIAVAESAAANKSIVTYRPDSSQAAAYRKIAEYLETL